jgi:hypothetical protein
MSDNDILSQLCLVETDFMSAIQGGSPTLLAFHSKWATLHRSVVDGVANESLHPTTLEYAHRIATMVEIIAENLLALQMHSLTLTSELDNQIGQILDDAGFPRLPDLPSPSSTSSCTRISENNSVAGGNFKPSSTCPPYIALAYKWLLKNIHNPYPTEETKEAISVEAGASRETVDDWFVRARKKMGWNALCKKHHAKSRKETLDAAYRFFIMPDPKRPLGGDLEYDLAAVLNAAKDMYSEKLLKSALAVKLDVVVKDMTPLDRERRKEERQMRQQRAKDQARAASSYPSPDRSPGRSPGLSLPSASTDESDYDISLPEPVAGRKRRSSSCDSPHEVPTYKRHRYISVVIPPACALTYLWQI